MNIKKTTIVLFLIVSIPLFSQNIAERKGIDTVETNLSYLDSIKKTFVNDDMASCVDSLWMKELTNLDSYSDIDNDIENINIDEKVDYELPTELLKSRLKAMNAKSPFKIAYNQSLENVIKSFLKYRKRAFERIMAISEYYFPIFEEEFAKRNIPLEIKYLAVVESALNPKAVSRVGATGLWQFMYNTGKQYNLKIDSYVDERKDPLKATAAAAKYMSSMYSIFGDWELVLASYNSGPGNVTKAIRRSGGKQNFWNIRKKLPKETQGYVPAFLATMYLYEYRNEHGIVPDSAVVQHFTTDTVMIKKEMSFKQISDLLDIPVSKLQALNPSYKLNIIPFYEDQDHYLRLPKEKIGVFTSNEDKIYAYVQHELDLKDYPFGNSNAIVKSGGGNYATQRVLRTRTKYYKVKKGDNLGTIANKYNVAVADLKKWNRIKGSKIVYGKSLKIITAERVVKKVKIEPKIEIASTQVKILSEEETKNEVKKDSSSVNSETIYIVKKGDNLNTIAEKNKVTIAKIKEWNHLTTDTIQPGDSLQLASKLMDVKGEVASTNTLKEAENDAENNTNKKSVNSFKEKEKLATTTQKKEISYLVQKGDSLYIIAKKYPGVTVSDIQKWNDIRGDEIKPGMKLKIRG